ncbi:DNA-processing protein DprA [Thermosediminibacter oceani]|uniref:DNA protecting protein DprA n=1 Tax=Thermosediminibacter oceani (strain ATCC BAA-1034 / DSM 16646 / JW/IW-1228P) TaxID=555079 RepID=D9S368_THEOJ|nr:DNA-processing protein DprA [Thermosediminibacter oceani]ADL07845.1 DNA protecting protein DprA [Thermosediminibacter oceani DSM 16646]
MAELELLVALNMIPNLGAVRIRELLNYFQTYSDFMNATRTRLLEVPGISEKICDVILEYKKRVNPYEEIKRAAKLGAKFLTLDDERYPQLLKEIYDPPPVLYVLGEVAVLNLEAVAIVGTRKPTPYGRKIAEQMARELASLEINVVSGMARGIDSIAHKGALEAGGTTTAVLGCGIDIVYPPENYNLMAEIIKAGCVISSFPMGFRPLPSNFPARNRIISGLSKGTLVVEAAEKSGSLITADFALDHGREVFAVPGSIFSPYSRGTHKLIKQGAKLVENVDDILEELNLRKSAGVDMEKGSVISLEEMEVLNLIDYHPTNVEVVVQKTGKAPQEINAIITRLQLKDLIASLPGGYVMRV